MGARSLAGGKPLDLGNGLVCASFAPDGTWLAIGGPHPEHGFVELSALPPFDESARGVPARVRQYRQLMTEPRWGFLSIEPDPVRQPVATHARATRGRTTHVRRYGGWRLAAVGRAARGSPSMVQRLTVRGDDGQPTDERPGGLRLAFAGTLDRPALAEITEISPPEPTAAATELVARGPGLFVRAAALPAHAVITVTCPDPRAGWQVTGGRAELLIEWPPSAAELVIDVEVSLESTAVVRRPAPQMGLPAVAASPPLDLPVQLRPHLQRIRRRSLEYVGGCTALRVGDDRVAILTDHRILPLSWARDAYYQALLLLGEAPRRPALASIVADHLRWLWLSCDRPAGTWARSHHANGRRKDEALQADQQLYPLLELADYWAVTGGLPELGGEGAAVGGWSGLVGSVVERLVASLSPAGLLATDENAADDAVAHPYLLANQILAWYCMRRLAELGAVLGLAASPAEVADRIRAGARASFTVAGRAGPMWAYAVDGRGGSVLYHDANDLPTALAPRWGFCTADDPLWQATVRFAFSAANAGYVAGPLGGLGSRHTPGVWPLGLAQEWVARSQMGETEAATRALERLVALAFADGSLPEASDPQTGQALARHWFAWPGAFLGCLVGSAGGDPSGG